MSVLKKVKVKVAQSVTLCDPMDYTVHGILQARILEWVAFPFSRGFSQPRDGTQISLTAGGFFTSWATRKPKNPGMGSLFLLQQIFPTQKFKQISCTAGRFFTNWAIRNPRVQKLYADSAKKSISGYGHSQGAGVVVLIQGAGHCCLNGSILWQAEIQFWASGSPSPHMVASP